MSLKPYREHIQMASEVSLRMTLDGLFLQDIDGSLLPKSI